MKLNLVIPFLLVASAFGFAPTQPFVRRQTAVLRMSDDDESSAIVPIKEETVEFTAGILGGVAGFAVGGPVLGAIGAALANYAAKNEGEVSEVVSTVSKTSIEVYNYLAKLDGKYKVLEKAQSSLEDALGKLKSNQSVDTSTVEKVEGALATTKEKISEINDEYDLVGASVTAFGVIGDLVEKAIEKAGELNDEYKLTGKASDALKTAVDKAKDTQSKM